jgi:hypothetical protein
MALKSFREIDGLKDPLKMYQITLSFGPGIKTVSNFASKIADNISNSMNELLGKVGINGGAIMGPNGIIIKKDFELRCTSFTYPGAKINTKDVVLFNHAKNFPVYNDKSGVLSVEVIEDMDGSVLTAINNWLDVIHNQNTGSMSTSEFYATNAMMDILGPNMRTTKRIYLHGVWPTELKSFQVNTSSSDAVKLTINFNYDWYSEMNTLL